MEMDIELAQDSQSYSLRSSEALHSKLEGFYVHETRRVEAFTRVWETKKRPERLSRL